MFCGGKPASPCRGPTTLVCMLGPFLQLCMVRTAHLTAGLALPDLLPTEQSAARQQGSGSSNKRAFALTEERPTVLPSVPSGRLFVVKQKRAYTLVNRPLWGEINGIS